MLKYLSLLFLVSILNFAQKNDFVKNAESQNAVILQIGEAKDWCSVCGMNLRMFYKTNHAVELKDGIFKQYCSIHCYCNDKPNIKDQIKNIFVVDSKTEKMINVKDVFYVVGSDVQGTMSNVSKIAFSSKIDAEEFRTKFNGKNIMDFKTVSEMVEKQLPEENNMLMKRKELKVYPKGEKLVDELCVKNIDTKKFLNIAELKAFIKANNICGSIDEQKLHTIALYLWEVKSKEKNGNSEIQTINIPQNEKCPVCGMLVYKYPKFAAVIESNDNSIYFDGVKDLMKFYLEPNKYGNKNKILFNKILVTDYYTQTLIDGKSATYVINSKILGPMGNELIPFSNEKNAAEFIIDHGGKLIKNFSDITKEIVLKLDE